MKKRIEELQQLLKAEPDESDCQQCLNQLDDYIAMQLAGKQYWVQFRQTAVHLDACISCAEAYARLYELAIAEAANTLPQPDSIPEPDLSFLRHNETTLLSRQIAASVKRVGEKLVLALSADLVELLRPLPNTSLVTRANESDRFGEITLELTPKQTGSIDFPLTLRVYQDRQRDGYCLIEVFVQPSGKSWPDIAGYQVIIHGVGETQTQMTDAWGSAIFQDMPIEQLQNLKIEATLTK
ncbi:MAG: hypothetical protein DWQ04_00270 [Chloroflexi bacterium]|nr:MAG: hypothetical protein DWQ04_00270 [Chloroflexota bacterium]